MMCEPAAGAPDAHGNVCMMNVCISGRHLCYCILVGGKPDSVGADVQGRRARTHEEPTPFWLARNEH